MATVLDLINDAYALIGEYDTSGVMSDADIQLGFRALNRMLASWSNDRSMVYEVRKVTLPLVAGTGTYAVSAVLFGGGPVKIETQNIIDASGVTHQLEQIDAVKAAGIGYPAAPGIPYWMRVEGAAPYTSLLFYPVPIGGLSAQLMCWYLLNQFAGTSETVTLPPGYEDALIYNLALRIAPMFDRTPAQTVTITAAQAKYAIETTNLPDTELSVASVPSSLGGSFDWRSGE